MADRACQFCGKVFNYPNQLRKHNKTLACYVEEKPVDLQNDLKQYECSKCNFKSLHISSLSRHKKTCKGLGVIQDMKIEETIFLNSAITKLQQQLDTLIALQRFQIINKLLP